MIVALSEMGLSSRKIAQKVGFNQSTVVRMLNKYRQTGTTNQIKGRGRKRLSTDAQDRMLVRACLRNRKATSAQLKREWEESCGVKATSRTVRNRLVKNGLIARRPRKKPLLTKSMRKARLDWAKRHRHWSSNDWAKVIFSDESKFNLHGTDGIEFVRRRTGEEFHPDCLHSTVKHPLGQMVWGCITAKGVGRLMFVKGTVNAEVYISILRSKLLPTIADMFGSSDECMFQDDSAPCHRAKKVSTLINH